MSEARALTNLIGNGVATVVVAKWTKDLDTERMKRILDNETPAEADTPEAVLDQVETHMPVAEAREPVRGQVEPHMPVAPAR
jgi:aerobic C4-dicarboxylate transport protein